MDESERTIEYFNVKPSKIYDSIDERLCILGGKEAFKTLTRETKVYAYDFLNIGTTIPRIGTAMVFVPPESNTAQVSNSNEDYQNTKEHSGTVWLFGFEQNSFYKKLCDALKELKNP
jgi:hypothetical protein